MKSRTVGHSTGRYRLRNSKVAYLQVCYLWSWHDRLHACLGGGLPSSVRPLFRSIHGIRHCRAVQATRQLRGTRQKVQKRPCEALPPQGLGAL